MENITLLTDTINMYSAVLSGYMKQFVEFGKWLFYSLAIITITWTALWKAFNHNGLQATMPAFIKEFFMIGFFYTIMINAAFWLPTILDSAAIMSGQINGAQKIVDPASILSEGIVIANKILLPAKNSGFFAGISVGIWVTMIAYFVIAFVFIAVALELAITIIFGIFLISMSGLMLAFGAFFSTRTIARRTLDAIIANGFKLLVLYLVIPSGKDLFIKIQNILPSETSKLENFDVYLWTMAAALLFLLVAKILPKKIEMIILNSIQEFRQQTSVVNSASKNTTVINPSITDQSVALTKIKNQTRGIEKYDVFQKNFE